MIEKMILALSLFLTGGTHVESDNIRKVEPKDEEMVAKKKGELNSVNYKNVEVAPIWEDQYDGTEGFDTFNSIIETRDGGFVAVGETTILTDVILGDANIVKYDKNGQIEWQNAVVGDDTEMFFDVKEDSDGNIFVIGKSHSSDIGFDNYSNHSNGILTMYNKDGEEQWIAPFSDNGIQIDYNDLAIVNDDIVIVGNKNHNGKKTGFIKVVNKSDGSDKSIKYYSDEKGVAKFNDITVNSKGDYIVSGSVTKEKESVEYPLVISVDGDTKEVNWSYSLSQHSAYNKSGTFNSLALDSKDNVYLSGTIKDKVNKSIVMKLSEKGRLEMIDVSKNIEWNEDAKSIQIKGDEVLITVEKTPNSSKYSYLKDIEMVLRGYSSDGELSFETRLSDDKNIRHMDTILTSEGDLLVAGRKYVKVNGSGLKCEVRNTEECVQADAYALMLDYKDKCATDEAPVLEVPNHTVNLEVGDKFDPMKGVKATDGGLDVTDKVVVNPSYIDTSIPGVHTITYKIADECSSVEKSVTVNVVKKDPCETNNLPIINAEDVVIEFGQEFDPMKGVTATDDGKDVTDKVRVVENNVNTNQSGEYKVTYKVVDECGATEKTITVTVNQNPCDINVGPELNIPNEIINLEIGESFDPMKGVTATDDGKDITDKITVTPSYIDTSIEGIHTITYRVADECSSVEKSVTVNVVKKDPCETNNLPIINVEDVVIEFGQEFDPMKGVTATDDGKDVTDKVRVVENNVNINQSGEYKVTYKVVDECGATEKTITVTVNQNPCDVNNLPIINAEDVVIEIGQEFDPMKGVTATDDGKDVTDKITVVKNDVDINNSGKYEVTYKVEDECGATEKTITVTVNQNPCDVNNLPIINAEDVVIEIGQEFDPMKGVTATDDGKDVTDKITVVKNDVDINNSGKYEVTYKVEDECGATEKTITVTVNPKVEDAVDEELPPIKEDKPNPPSENKPETDNVVTEKPQTGDSTFIYGLLAISSTSGIYFVNRKRK